MAMSTQAAQPLVYRAIPADGTMRIAAFILLAIAGSLLIAVAGQIKVPFYPVPATLQTLAVFVIAATFGLRLGVATVALYLVEGAAGMPVFTGGAGLAYLAGPTGGFLAGFLAAAAIIGWTADRTNDRKPLVLFAATLIGATVLMAMGWTWLSGLIGAEKAWMFGVQPFILGELAKVALAASLVPALHGIFARR